MSDKILKIIGSLAVISFFAYLSHSDIESLYYKLYDKYFPCDRSIEYWVVDFDTHFGISKDYFLKAIAEAEAVWEKPTNRELFKLGTSLEDKRLAINLVYDYRQEATTKIQNLDQEIDETRISYDSLRKEFEIKKSEYLGMKEEYENFVRELKRKQDVSQKEIEQVRNMEKELNGRANEINTLVTSINSLARDLNLDVSKINNLGLSRGEEFTQGEYRIDDNGEEINIYEFSTHEKLVRVLAHELGHALGLDHIEDSEAIMYRLNENTTGKLSLGDLQNLKNHCKIK